MNNIRSSTAPISRIIKYCVICLISLRSVFTAIKCISEPFCAFLYTDRNDRVPFPFIQLFRERLSEKVHATIPKGIVGGFLCSRFFKEIWKNDRRGHGRMLASAKGKQQKLVRQLQCQDTVYWSYPILPFGIVACIFFSTTFLEIAVYGTSTSEIPPLSYTQSLKKLPLRAQPPGKGHHREYPTERFSLSARKASRLYYKWHSVIKDVPTQLQISGRTRTSETGGGEN